MDSLNTFFPNHCGDTFFNVDLNDDFRTKQFHKPTIKVFAAEGGGTRGIIEALFAQKIEEHTKLPICALYDLLSGTSIGAVLTVALLIPKEEGSRTPKYSAADTVGIIESQAAKIFPYQAWYKAPAQLWGPKYSSDGLSEVLKGYYGDFRLVDSLKDIVIPTAELTQGKPWWFTRGGVLLPPEDSVVDSFKPYSSVKEQEVVSSEISAELPVSPSLWSGFSSWWNGSTIESSKTALLPLEGSEVQFFVSSNQWGASLPIAFPDRQHPFDPQAIENLPAIDIMEATTAAPTYLPPKSILIGTETLNFIDGGVFANNPADKAVSYAESLFGNGSPYLVTCLGAGYCPSPMTPNWYNSGSLFWGVNFSSEALSLASADVYTDLGLKFRNSGDNPNLFIFNPEISREDFTLDDSSKEHLDRLKDVAEAYYEEHHEQFHILSAKLKHEYHVDKDRGL